MPDRPAVGVLIDGTFESLLTVVYNYFYEKVLPVEIWQEDRFQPTLGTSYIRVAADLDKFGKVKNAIHEKFSEPSVANISYAFFSGQERRFILLFQYIAAGFKLGHSLDNYLQYDFVAEINNMRRNVGWEAQHLRGFLRFSTTPDGIFYADISPKNYVLPILAEHFSDRLCDERFVIHDVLRNLAVLYDGKQWTIAEVPAHANLNLKLEEDHFQKLWTVFYNAIGIEERVNPKQRRTMMPKRFWKHMTEFKTQL